MIKKINIYENLWLSLGVLNAPANPTQILKNFLSVSPSTQLADFNEAFTRLVRAEVFIKNGELYEKSPRFSEYYGKLAEDISKKHWLFFCPDFFNQDMTIESFVSSEEFDEAVKKAKRQNSPILGLSLFTASFLLVVAAIVLIVLARVSEYQFLLLAMVMCIFAVVLITLGRRPLSRAEFAYKRKKFDEFQIDTLKINLDKDIIKEYFKISGYKQAQHQGDPMYLTDDVYEDFFTNWTRPERNFKFNLVYACKAEAIEETMQAIKRDVYVLCRDEVVSSPRHRIIIVFLFKENVQDNDVAELDYFLDYDKIGEFPQLRIPLYFPLLYDKSKGMLYYKNAKIPWGWGSSLNYAQRIVGKMLKYLSDSN